MLPFRQTSPDIFPGTKKSNQRKPGRGDIAWGQDYEALKFHLTLLIIPLHLLFCRQAWRPKQSGSDSPQLPQGERNLSASLKGKRKKENKVKQKS